MMTLLKHKKTGKIGILLKAFRRNGKHFVRIQYNKIRIVALAANFSVIRGIGDRGIGKSDLASGKWISPSGLAIAWFPRNKMIFLVSESTLPQERPPPLSTNHITG